MKHIGMILLAAFFLNQALFADDGSTQKCGNGSKGQKCLGAIIDDSHTEGSSAQKCGNGSNGQKCLGAIIDDSQIDCSLKINALIPECKTQQEPTAGNKCPISRESWNAKCTQDSGVRCIKAPCPQARKMVSSAYCKKTASLCGGDGLSHGLPNKECSIAPGAKFAKCKGAIYIRQDHIDAKYAVDSATAVLFPKDVKTLGEEPRSIGEKPMDVSDSSSVFESSSTDK
ncbi:MAG: hypothetical protein COW00_03540 [Bdellovibrio sp. CG12_big_fil_rev_8_21_14_0_65_39_13]|nr:MAG: hypothetical protein COW78_19540 [Bdellovibrio sp. CG22_combo_CG10-13_8_21_14_all_39_27]PIQ61533.1 MAG: hypothetical protein COW00_03540 [Bdellovibrio sp. CG12_big_fil_rev_8_21_14_0_65_39_13]PIR35950.1 MAG: hypothetical protein COV37_06030 [Bdellovibrio sp. CG11_big_fil_rev_8_21_14_0_20_39_38]